MREEHGEPAKVPPLHPGVAAHERGELGPPTRTPHRRLLGGSTRAAVRAIEGPELLAHGHEGARIVARAVGGAPLRRLAIGEAVEDGIGCGHAEVAAGLRRRTEVGEAAARSEHEQVIDLGDDLRREVVGDHEHDPAAIGELPHQPNDVLRGAGVQAAGRLVEKQHPHRAREELLPEVHALALATGNAAANRIADTRGPDVLDAQLREHTIHLCLDFGGRGAGGEAQARPEL